MDAVKTPPRWLAAAEVAAFYAMTLGIIWIGDKFRPTIVIIALALIALCAASNRFHGDTKERVGLDGKHFWPALKLTALVTLPVLIPLFFYGLTKRFYWPWNFAFSALGYPIWGFAQEYALLGFVYNRLEDALPGRQALLPWINGFLFALAHLPNPVLMATTFVAGVVFTAIFQRHRNLFPIALAHAAVGVAISMAFADVSGIMSVGPGYERRLGEPPWGF